MEWIIRLKKRRTLSLLGLVVRSSLYRACLAYSGCRLLKENTAWLCLLWPSLALVCVTSGEEHPPPPNSLSHLALPLMALEQKG